MKATILIYCCLMMTSSTCGRLFPSGTSAEQPTPAPPREIQVIARQSQLAEKNQTSWRARETALGTKPSLKAVYFSDESHGWIGGASATLYKTEDGGTNWQPITLGVPRDMNVQSILFLDAHTGWVVLERPRDIGEDSQRPSFIVMRTIDGGLTWQSQYQENNAAVTQLIISSEKSGWLTGVAYEKPLLRYFILHTKDQGDHWEDVADQLRSIASDGTSNVGEWIMGIISSGRASTTVITSEFRLFRTSDEGKTWQRIGSLQDLNTRPNVIRRFDSINGTQLWTIGGSNSAHSGTRGVLVVQQNENLWVKHILYDAFFQDAASLPQNQFLATGSVAKVIESGGINSTKDEAVVLSTIDGGENWVVVYRNPRIRSVNSINAVNDSLAWAVGDAGLVIRLENQH